MFNWVSAKLQNCSSIVGLDIGTTAIKLVELSQQAGLYQLEGYASITLPKKIPLAKGTNDTTFISEAIRSLTIGYPRDLKNVAIAVPDVAVFSKIIQVDHDFNDADIENFILLEADRLIPHPMAEVRLDFQVLGKNAHDPLSIDVLLVAARKETVAAAVAIAETSGMKVKVVDIQAHAVERAAYLIAQQLSEHRDGKIIAIVELGISSITLIVLQQSNNIFMHNEAIVSFDSQMFAAFEDFIVSQIQRCLQFYLVNFYQGEIEQLFLAGGYALIPGLITKVTEKLKINTSLANPFGAMRIASNVSITALNQIAPSLLVACGLALRDFDISSGSNTK